MKAFYKNNRTALILFVFILVLVPLFTANAWTIGQYTDLTTQAELSSFDFSSGVGRVSRMLFSFYPGELYTPDDFAKNENIPSSDPNTPDRKTVACATCRITLHLKEGTVYAINADSATYAQKLWVDGKLLSSVGQVSKTADGFVPKTLNYIVCFTAGSSPTEIVIERSNYVHTYADFFELVIGPQNLISQMVKLRLVRIMLVLGAMLTSCLYFLIAYYSFHNQTELLYFAAAIFFITIRSSFVNPKPVMIFFPELSWYLGHKLECCSLIAAMLFIQLFYNKVFPKVVPKAVRITGYALTIFFILWYAVLPSSIYTLLTTVAHYLLTGYIGFYLVSLVIGIFRRRHASGHYDKKMENGAIGSGLTLAGGAVCIFYVFFDTFRYRNGGDINLLQTGLLSLIFTVMLGMMLRIREMQKALVLASNREDAILQKNRELMELSQLRSGFMADISHEMKTPLTVISSYAGLTKMQIENNQTGSDTLENLDIVQHEAVRLGTLTEQIKASAARKEITMQQSLLDTKDILMKAARFCDPICEKNGNRIEILKIKEKLPVRVAEGSIFQVLYNLIANSNRHSSAGVILLSAEKEENCVRILVSDSGTGMDTETASHAFERGFSSDGSSGFGLSICRTIVEEYGGSISLKSSLGSGTEVTILLPLAKEES
ncbi:MAG: sensor histidine kinase [Lachnospiraceae bacterium]|jgi:signal transduction histidine kinase|nr:sensor histidine kinase [Lachnospiraceae bacterium]MCI1727543.1 sensor histidine kinase [Lachnospiraceae bacterium]